MPIETENWDVIVVGSGLGGMTSACLLAMAGRRVLLLERHTVAGGFTHTFKRKGFEWDVGVHYVGGRIWKPGAILRRIFDYVTDAKLEWEPMDETYDRAVIAGQQYDFVAGLEPQIRSLAKHFPQEESAIRGYYNCVQKVARSSPWFFGEKTMPEFLSRTLGWLLRRKFEKWACLTTREVIETFTKNEKLIAVLCAQCGDYGLPPAKSSFGIHAIVVEHYLNGASYPRGGADRISETILNVFKKAGGTLALKTEVARLLSSDGRVTGVELKDGRIVRAPVVVSNVGVRNTLALAGDVPQLALAKQELAQLAPSTAHVCLYLGLDATDEELRLPKHNIWIYDRTDFDSALNETTPDSIPLVYVSFPSAKDPWRSEKSEGRATIQAIAACSMEALAAWSDLPWPRKEANYLALKERWKAELTKKLIEQMPRIEGHIVHSELSTPLSTKHFSNYQAGEIYGLEHTPARFAARTLRPRTRLKGLFLAGQDVVTVGVGGALYSGVLTATSVLKKSVIVRILLKRPLRA